jgi:cytochrome c oxidase subunit 2
MTVRRGASLARAALLLLPLLLLAGCADDDAPSVTSPRSEAAERVEGLWWLTFWISVVVVVFVTAFIVRAIMRSRAPEPEQAEDGIDKRPVAWGERFIVIAGVVVSGVILAGSFVVSLRALDALAGPSELERAFTIEVIGHNWWWEARYPNGAVTANEIHIPVDREVEVVLTTADVIHSFWVPQLNVKQDQVPGMENSLWLRAKEPGRYRGQCAEFCGLQHARMVFYVVAQPQAQFDQWLANEAAPAREPTTGTATTGRDIFLKSSCAGCHAVKGTTAVGTLGPDLTHMASRETIGAGVLPLTRDNLSDFVLDAQHSKPGNSMPPTEIAPHELSALVDYLMGLE